MKKSDVIMAKLGRGAASTVLATALVAQNQAADAAPLRPADDLAHSIPSVDLNAGNATEMAVQWVVSDVPNEWDKKLEREFRKLALSEAQGNISQQQAARLEQLNRWRNELLYPPTAEDVLLQLKRDSLLLRMEKLLKEYVEFEASANKKR